MTLTAEQSSNKELYEALPTDKLEGIIRVAMSQGCIRPCHVYDAVDEVLDRLSKLEKVLAKVDLTKCAPLPWKSKLWLHAIADTGDYNGGCSAYDANGEQVFVKDVDGPDYKEVELEDGDHDADILAICDSVNAVAEAKKILNIGTRL